MEGGGDSGKDDTSDKDMEEEEECKSFLKSTKLEEVEGQLVNHTFIYPVHIIFCF